MKYWVLSDKGKRAWEDELVEWFALSEISSVDELGMTTSGDDRIYFNTATQKVIGGEFCGGRADSFWRSYVRDDAYVLVATRELAEELESSGIDLPDGIKVI